MLNTAACGPTHEATVAAGCGHELKHGGGKSLAPVCRDERSGFAGQLTDSADIGGDEGLLHGHGFAEGERHTFPGGGEDEGICGFEQVGNVVAEAEEVDAFASQIGVLRGIAFAADPEFGFGVFGLNQREGTEEVGIVLGRNEATECEPEEGFSGLQGAAQALAPGRV